MFTEGWFDWIEVFPIWLQFVIAVPIGMILTAVIMLCIWGINKEIDWLVRIWEDIKRSKQ